MPLRDLHAYSASVTRFSGAEPIEKISVPLVDGATVSVSGGTFQVSLATSLAPHGGEKVTVTFSLTDGAVSSANVGVDFHLSDWKKENFLLMPSAAYNGNRYEVRAVPYPPMLRNQKDMGLNAPTIMTDVPRLNIGEGESRIEQLSRDLSTPAIGVYEPEKKSGFFLLTDQDTPWGVYGYILEENADRTSATLSVEAPGVRHTYMYRHCTTTAPSWDIAPDFKKGDSVTVEMILYTFAASCVQDLFDEFALIRYDATSAPERKEELPFSACWKIQEKLFNTEHYDEKHGFYMIGNGKGACETWQMGWTGGLMPTFALLLLGSERSHERVQKNFDFALSPNAIGKTGLFYGMSDGEVFLGDNFRCQKDPSWLLIRKDGDGLYYIVKQFLLMEEIGMAPKEEWKQAAKNCADAFCRLWEKFGQFGQFVNTEEDEIFVGGSACGGIIPAALSLAARYFGEPKYLKVAEEAARKYNADFTEKGVSTGGPGEILQCPDSESAFGLLESFVVLYEETGKEEFRTMAKNMGTQCLTWCMTYDFRFPKDTTFGKMGMRSNGAVFANVQNKHGAPGICTLSGDSFLKLYRMTGDITFLHEIRDIAHNITQYLSREDRIIDGNHPGWMSERVQTSDWLEPIGEVCHNPQWPGVTCMMTIAEIPGIYVETDTGEVTVFDNVTAKVTEKGEDSLTLEITNPTNFPADVHILAESSVQQKKPLGDHVLLGKPSVHVDSGETVTYVVR